MTSYTHIILIFAILFTWGKHFYLLISKTILSSLCQRNFKNTITSNNYQNSTQTSLISLISLVSLRSSKKKTWSSSPWKRPHSNLLEGNPNPASPVGSSLSYNSLFGTFDVPNTTGRAVPTHTLDTTETSHNFFCLRLFRNATHSRNTLYLFTAF